jgi:hypothetical protein
VTELLGRRTTCGVCPVGGGGVSRYMVALMNCRDRGENARGLIQTDPIRVLRLLRIAFEQPVGVADAAAVTFQKHGTTSEWAQPGVPVAYAQTVVWLDRVAQLHSFAGFARHG